MFDFVAGDDVVFFGFAHGVVDGPIFYFHRHFGGQFFAADVYDDVEAGHRHMFQIFREVLFEADVFGLHHLFGEGLNDGSGRKSGTGGVDDICAVFPREAFGHLTADGVTNAKKQNFFHAI